MALAPTWRDGLVNHWLQTAADPGSLPDVYVQLYLVLPDETGVGGVVPDAGDGYDGPVNVTGATFWPDSVDGDGESLSQAAIAFGTPTLDWGPILGAALTEADGTLITVPEEFDDPYDVEVGEPFELPVSAIGFQAS